MFSKMNFCWPKEAFKNFLSFWVATILLYMIYTKPELRDVASVLLMLIGKHYWDSSVGSNKKDDTINSMANSIPDADNKK